MPTKFIFVTGGVISSLGKGITVGSIGTLLKRRGLNIRLQKFDPYINVDTGTMNPQQHGEVYVTEDGGGHWERLQKGLPEPFDTMVRSIVQDEDGALFAAAEGDVYVSTDDGDSWTQAASGLPVVRALAVV